VSNMLFHAHSGLRYLLLLAAVVALAIHLYGRFAGRPYSGAARISGAAFVGLLDVQLVVGLVLLAVWPFHGALIGHIVMMLLAVAAAHGLRVWARRSAADPERYLRAALAVAVPLVLIVGGILAIGRSVV
jgi:hypothetical protein